MEKKVLIENKAIDADKLKVTFGIGSITKPTPKLATKIFRGVLYAAGIASLAATVFTDLPVDIKQIVWQYSAQFVALTHGVVKLFGWDLKDK